MRAKALNTTRKSQKKIAKTWGFLAIPHLFFQGSTPACVGSVDV